MSTADDLAAYLRTARHIGEAACRDALNARARGELYDRDAREPPRSKSLGDLYVTCVLRLGRVRGLSNKLGTAYIAGFDYEESEHRRHTLRRGASPHTNMPWS